MRTDSIQNIPIDKRHRNPNTRFNRPELMGALAVLVVGLIAIAQASAYSFGELRRMGPGFFPMMTAVAFTVLGIALIIQSKRATTRISCQSIQPFAAVIGSLAVWMLLIRTTGFVLATFGLVVIAALAQKPIRLGPALWLAVGLSAAGAVLFVYVLGIRAPLFPW